MYASTVPSGASVTSRSDHAASARVADTAKNQPSAVPADTSTRLSTTSWRKRRARLPPSAVRRLNSRWRAVLRAASSKATLPHAIVSTTITIAISIRSGWSYWLRSPWMPRADVNDSCGGCSLGRRGATAYVAR